MTDQGKGIEPKPNNTVKAFGDMRETGERVLTVARRCETIANELLTFVAGFTDGTIWMV